MASVLASIYVGDYGIKDKPSPYIDATFDISDCSRVISLDFHGSDKSSIENNLFKLDTLIGALHKFREVYELEQRKILEKDSDNTE